jgi:UDP-N-acetylglucosamine transferase subunit ALG13
MPSVHGAFRGEHFDEVLSTGSALALSVMVAAWFGSSMERTYVESVARVNGPSVTGRILAALHLAGLYTQYPSWASDRWRLTESVLAQFESVPGSPAMPDRPLRLFVTLGTIKPYRFDSVVDRVLAVAPDAEIVWQLGATPRADLPGVVHEQVGQADFLQLAAEADAVVTHAGVGSILGLLEAGVHPVVVPRRSARGEHVDDHQLQISGLVADLGVATVADSAELTLGHLRRAAGLRIVAAR